MARTPVGLRGRVPRRPRRQPGPRSVRRRRDRRCASIPGLSGYRTPAVALGTLALYAFLVTADHGSIHEAPAARRVVVDPPTRARWSSCSRGCTGSCRGRIRNALRADVRRRRPDGPARRHVPLLGVPKGPAHLRDRHARRSSSDERHDALRIRRTLDPHRRGRGGHRSDSRRSRQPRNGRRRRRRSPSIPFPRDRSRRSSPTSRLDRPRSAGPAGRPARQRRSTCATALAAARDQITDGQRPRGATRAGSRRRRRRSSTTSRRSIKANAATDVRHHGPGHCRPRSRVRASAATMTQHGESRRWLRRRRPVHLAGARRSLRRRSMPRASPGWQRSSPRQTELSSTGEAPAAGGGRPARSTSHDRLRGRSRARRPPAIRRFGGPIRDARRRRSPRWRPALDGRTRGARAAGNGRRERSCRQRRAACRPSTRTVTTAVAKPTSVRATTGASGQVIRSAPERRRSSTAGALSAGARQRRSRRGRWVRRCA